MKIVTRTAAAALLISLPMGLSACGGNSKPSKDDVKAGYSKAVKKQVEKLGVKVPDSTIDKMGNCIIDGAYDKVSATSLKSIKDGKTTKDGDVKVAKKDKPKFESASKKCQAKYKDELSKLG